MERREREVRWGNGKGRRSKVEGGEGGEERGKVGG